MRWGGPALLTADKSLTSEGQTGTHHLFIVIYTSGKPPHHSSSFNGPPPERRATLVDPRQLLHDLDHLVHCGLTLHAATIIDLKHKWHHAVSAGCSNTDPAHMTDAHMGGESSVFRDR